MSHAPLHEDSDRDVVVSVQDGNYRMVEVARVTAPADSGTPRRVTVTFDPNGRSSFHRPATITVEFADGHVNALSAPSGDAQGERGHRDGTAAQGSSAGDTGGRA